MIPLHQIEDYNGNVYEMTVSAIKEADILSQPGCGGEEIEKKNEKIVSVVLEKAMDGEIKYQREDGTRNDEPRKA